MCAVVTHDERGVPDYRVSDIRPLASRIVAVRVSLTAPLTVGGQGVLFVHW